MYATKKTFAGQRASLTRAVVIKINNAPFAGTIIAVDGDTPIFSMNPIPPSGNAIHSLTFYDAKTESDLESMPNDSWTWPPRV